MGKTSGKIGTCAYCGADGVEVTDDHVFPDSWYPDDHPPSERLLVPSCSPCNHRYGQLEERMFLPLTQMLHDPRAEALQKRAQRTADPSAGSFLGKTTIIGPRASVPPGAMWNRTGRKVGIVGESELGEVIGTPVVRFGWENLEPIIFKLLRGCYYAVHGKPLPQDPPLWAQAAVKDPTPVIEQAAAIPGAVVRGAYPFKYILVSAKPEMTLGFFILWDEIVLWAGNIPQPND